jgi:hypothetical protein
MWRGTMHFQVLHEIPYKGKIQINDAESEACVCSKQVKTKSMYIALLLNLKINT